MNNKIDFVILWVDYNDKKWQEEKDTYLKIENKNLDDIDVRNVRYRDYDTLKYWFRGVEKYAPWVNRIHFITYGHVPSWLNTANPKIHIVNHSDYMPKDALPTFNSNSIEMLIHKINGLEEQFVLFNDDTFILKKVKEKDFFKKGKPCNSMVLEAIMPFNDKKFYKTIANDIEIINNNFNFKKCVKKNIFKYLSLKQGKYILQTYPLLLYYRFVGFANFHLPNSYLKSTFKEVWDIEKNDLEKTVYCKFRNNEKNLNHWLFNYWQFATGNFCQRYHKFGYNLDINEKQVPNIIKKQKYYLLGLADNDKIDNFEQLKEIINNSFNEIFPEKSSFEL